MYFEERFNEKKEDPLNDKITFRYPLCITVDSPDEDNETDFSTVVEKFNTKYKFHSTTWHLLLSRFNFSILNEQFDDDDGQPILVWNGTCFCSYNLYSDTEKRILLYSSPRTEMRNGRNSDAFTSPAGFSTKLDEALNESKVAKFDVFIELQLPAKYFYRPYEMPTCYLSKYLCDVYPTDNGFETEFLNNSDFVFKCPDGEMPAMRIILNNASEFMHERFNAFPNGNELAVHHSIDVIKPIISCFHTRNFQMPKTYDLDYARRLLMARDFFNPRIKYRIKSSIYLSLLQKFGEEKHTFNSILQWLKIAYHHYLSELQNMVTVVISDKFYFEWHQTFPENARNDENQIFHDIFNSYPDRFGLINRPIWIFRDIDFNMRSSLKTVIVD